jgi:hypothetical protein
MNDEAKKEKAWDKQITTYLVEEDATKPWYTLQGTGLGTGEKTKYVLNLTVYSASRDARLKTQFPMAIM